MNQMKSKLCISMLSVVLTTPILAQDLQDPRSKIGPFVGVATGAAGFGYRDSVLESNEIGDIKQSGTVAKFEAGYWFSDHWGVSLNHAELGEMEQKFTQGTFRGTGDSTAITILGRLPFGEKWSLVGKANISSAEVQDDGSTIDSKSLDKLTGKETSLLPGIEIDYHINEQAALFMELEGRGSVSDDAGLAFFGLGLRWAF